MFCFMFQMFLEVVSKDYIYIYTLIRISCHYELIPNKSIDPDSVFSAFSSSTNRPMLHGTKRRRLGACENDVNLHAENQKCGNP